MPTAARVRAGCRRSEIRPHCGSRRRAAPSCRPPARRTPRYYCRRTRSEEHTSELQSLMRTSYAVFCLKKKKKQTIQTNHSTHHHIYKTHKQYKTLQHTPNPTQTQYNNYTTIPLYASTTTNSLYLIK